MFLGIPGGELGDGRYSNLNLSLSRCPAMSSQLRRNSIDFGWKCVSIFAYSHSEALMSWTPSSYTPAEVAKAIQALGALRGLTPCQIELIQYLSANYDEICDTFCGD